jgi:glycosyltransferase involved in cell wall biosynthesis
VNIVVVASALPIAHGKGYQVRLYHQILELGLRHKVTLIAFSQAAAGELPPELAQACASISLVPLPIARIALSMLSNLGWLPLTVGYFQSPLMAEAIKRARSGTRFDVAHVQLIRMAPYRQYLEGIPKTLDLVDALSANMYERSRASNPLLGIPLGVEARRLRDYEATEIGSYDSSVVVSESERVALGAGGRVTTIPNGIELDEASRRPNWPFRSGIVLTGTMSYFSNEDAAVWFSTRILRLVRAADPGVRFTIVGRNPCARVRRLARLENVAVTGAVDSVRDHLTQAAVAVCPTRFGTGLQTKILEAMAAGTPVVATSRAAAGLPTDLQDKLVLADSPEAFASAVLRLLRSPAEARDLAAAALSQVQAHTWAKSVAELETCYEQVIGRAGR